MIREKANGNIRVLILNRHQNHVTSNFITHYMQNNIELLHLLSHTSHFLQSLNIDIFAPLKKALSAEFDSLVRTKVAQI